MENTNSEYDNTQKEVRLHIVNLLKRSNGTITKKEYLKIFNPKCERQDKLKERLFLVTDLGELEWKRNISSENALLKKIGASKNNISEEVLKLFYSSRQIQNRSLFPHIVCARQKNQYQDEASFPVFGFDILIRSPTKFTEGAETNNSFKIGSHAFVYFIHAKDDQYMLRANMGNDIMKLGINHYLDREISNSYEEIQSFYDAGDYHQFVYKFCEASNNGIRKWYFSGV